MPGETTTDVIDHIEKVVGDKRVQVSVISEMKSDLAPVSPVNVAGFKNLLTALRQVYPEAAVAPTMMLGASDSRYFAEVSKNIYRFAPIIVNPEEMASVHGLNERTRIEDFKRGMTFYYQLIKISSN